MFYGFSVTGQGLAAYSDYKGYFYIFDRGEVKEAEYREIASFKTGKRCIAYVDNNKTLKVYYNGEFYEMFPAVDEYIVTDQLVIAELNKQLKVFENGRMTTLTTAAGDYAWGDSLVAFIDNMQHKFRLYYNSKITDLEDLFGNHSIRNIDITENILAYVDQNNYLKIVLSGRNIGLGAGTVSTFKAGMNIIAYYDEPGLSFEAYYRGRIYHLDDYEPDSYETGKNMVVFVDNSGTFKVFDDGEIYTVSNAEPEFYKVKDEMIVYSEQGYLKVFYKGQNYELEKYIPDRYEFENSCFVYIDYMGWLKVFDKGYMKTLTKEHVSEFYINYDTVFFREGINTNRVYCNRLIY